MKCRVIVRFRSCLHWPTAGKNIESVAKIADLHFSSLRTPILFIAIAMPAKTDKELGTRGALKGTQGQIANYKQKAKETH